VIRTFVELLRLTASRGARDSRLVHAEGQIKWQRDLGWSSLPIHSNSLVLNDYETDLNAWGDARCNKTTRGKDKYGQESPRNLQAYKRRR
jgi:hypothetical protein